MSGRWRIGLLGGGDIAPRYARSLMTSDKVELVAAASRSPASAARCAEVFGGTVVTPEAMLTGGMIDAVVILTPPQHHESAIRTAIAHGIHAYCEKPFAMSLDGARTLAALAEDRGVMLAAAPAVHLGPSLGRARDLVEDGTLGALIGGAATLVYPGPDLWHHNPDHLFAQGGGPIWDMGVYHLAALVFLLGPIAQVQAFGTVSRDVRTIRQGPRSGYTIPVEVPTHVSALLQFESGPVVTLTCSFDGFASRAPGLELYGTKGALALGHPNDFAAPLHLSTRLGEWREIAGLEGWTDAMWSIGPIEALSAFVAGQTPRTAPQFAAHIIEVMAAIERLCHEPDSTTASIASRCSQPEPITSYDGLGWSHPADTGQD